MYDFLFVFDEATNIYLQSLKRDNEKGNDKYYKAFFIFYELESKVSTLHILEKKCYIKNIH